VALLGSAALAMWWNMAPGFRTEFEHWHSHEHFPERLAIPGFLRGSRWSCVEGGDGVFVMYELDRFSTLSSDAYLARLNAPTPWSERLMPHHRDMVRSQCRVVLTEGGVAARHLLTVRLAAQAGRTEALHARLGSLARGLGSTPGLVGAHLLRHESPLIGTTAEQRIRGLADRSADSVLLVCGYDEGALRRLTRETLDPATLTQAGADGPPIPGIYTLSHSAIATDVA